MKKQFNNFTEIERMIDFLNIKEVTTSRQKENGTREFKLPMNDPYGDAIHVASYSTGYVRRTRTSSRSDWQLNKTKKEKRYVEMTDYDTGRPVIRTFHDTVRVLIDNEQDRLAYLISYCLKNYYINQANKLSNGDYISKWKHEYELERHDVDRDDGALQQLSVIVNNERYNII
jgi:hypothetical protein